MKKFLATAFVAAGLMAALPTPKANAQEPFLGQMSWFAGNFAPRGWAFCDGQILPINQNQSLYSLLGTTYGGDGRTSFALPDMRGRTPIHFGHGAGLSDYPLGQKAGVEFVTLTPNQLPAHSHTTQLKATADAADGTSPSGAALAESSENMYAESASATGSNLASSSIVVLNSGNSQAHENRMPYTALNCIIALQGLFPSRN